MQKYGAYTLAGYKPVSTRIVQFGDYFLKFHFGVKRTPKLVLPLEGTEKKILAFEQPKKSGECAAFLLVKHPNGTEFKPFGMKEWVSLTGEAKKESETFYLEMFAEWWEYRKKKDSNRKEMLERYKEEKTNIEIYE